MNKAIHYSGGLIVDIPGGTRQMLAGWPACVTGDQAWKVRFGGNQSDDPGEVTCKRCQALIALAVTSGD